MVIIPMFDTVRILFTAFVSASLSLAAVSIYMIKSERGPTMSQFDDLVAAVNSVQGDLTRIARDVQDAIARIENASASASPKEDLSGIISQLNNIHSGLSSAAGSLETVGATGGGTSGGASGSPPNTSGGASSPTTVVQNPGGVFTTAPNTTGNPDTSVTTDSSGAVTDTSGASTPDTSGDTGATGAGPVSSGTDAASPSPAAAADANASLSNSDTFSPSPPSPPSSGPSFDGSSNAK